VKIAAACGTARGTTKKSALDHPKRTEELLALLKASVPFEREITAAVVKHLQNDDVALAPQARFFVSDVSYARDEVASSAT
jgi:hypothetical protein